MATNAVATGQKLADLRQRMRDSAVVAYIVPSSDPHLLESPPPRFSRREFISGFTGSAGTAVVTQDKAALWTDGRYFIQAESELTDDWTLMKMDTPGCPEIPKWLGSVLASGSRVGVDPYVHSETQAAALSASLKEQRLDLVGIYENLVDAVWGAELPIMPSNPLVIQPLELAGESTTSKLKRIRHEMEEKGTATLLISKPEEIAWTLNLRGADDEYAPYFLAYLLVTSEDCQLYVDVAKITPPVEAYLKEMEIGVAPYDEMLKGFKSRLATDKGGKVWLDPNLTTHALFLAARECYGAESETQIVTKETPWTMFMAVKNEQELNGMRDAHIRDATAEIEFLAWFEQEIAKGRVFTEVEVHEELTARRAVQPGFKSLSFYSIVGSNANGAIIHYHPKPGACGTVDGNSMVLIDSGAQYDSGTTDVTRTFHTGTPTEYQRTCFTKTLQGHIAMATSVFPEDTPGIAIDAFARRPLWSLGLQYMHGTGHGIGAHMCVHEGPISVSFRAKSAMAQNPLKQNMVISNEPGYYECGQFGIRIENICIIKNEETPFAANGSSFLGLETITLIPIQKKLIKVEDLSKDEIAWLNGYHQKVWDTISPRLSDAARGWLKESTAPLS